MTFLNSAVSAKRIPLEHDKLRAVPECFTPKNLKHLWSLWGSCTGFRNVIPYLSHVAEPLYELQRRAVNCTWGPAQDKSFESLNEAMASEPVLSNIIEVASTELRTHASPHGIGTVLDQNGQGASRVIPCAIRKLEKCERNYLFAKMDCLAVIRVICKTPS